MAVLDTTLCDKVCQLLPTDQWFSWGTPVSSVNKTDRHNITEIFLKVAFKHHTPLLLINIFLIYGILCHFFSVPKESPREVKRQILSLLRYVV